MEKGHLLPPPVAVKERLVNVVGVGGGNGVAVVVVPNPCSCGRVHWIDGDDDGSAAIAVVLANGDADVGGGTPPPNVVDDLAGDGEKGLLELAPNVKVGDDDVVVVLEGKGVAINDENDDDGLDGDDKKGGD